MFSKPPQSFLIGGERSSGPEVRAQNVTASLAIANVVKSSLGPVGLDKMLVDDIGDVTITNDGATILSLLEVEHPAARILVDLAQQQDKEVGDGTTSVVLLAAELLKLANQLIQEQQLHPTTVILGYRLAAKEATRFIKDQMSIDISKVDREVLENIAATAISSKVIGSDSKFFSKLLVDAVLALKFSNSIKSSSGTSVISSKTMSSPVVKININSINILKAHGRSMTDSKTIKGYALNCTRASQAMPKRIEGAKIACLDLNLQKAKMPMGVQVVIEDPNELEAIRQREMDMTIEKIKLILDAGANVVLTTKGIDDMCLKCFVEANAIAVRRVDKEDMRRIAKATGATLLSTLATLEEDFLDAFDSSNLGHADFVFEEKIGDGECLIIEINNLPNNSETIKRGGSSSIILRGANDILLEEMHRSVTDALSALKRTIETGTVVPGGGAVEAALSIYLENFATTLGSKEQLAIAEFATALLTVPKNLATNAAKNSLQLVAKLRAYHHAWQSQAISPKENITTISYKNCGLDLTNGKIVDNLKHGVLEPAISKIKQIKAATEAAISILRIDDWIQVNPEKREDPRDECS